jgi:predicted DNA-binding antitoxin AbrB/MazE fold protein
VIEVDICSSHPRIAIQEFHGECISATFYQDIAYETGILKPKVKKYFQVALSSGSRVKAYRGFLKGGYDRRDFEALESLVQSRYPKVPLYCSWSLEAMNHEGELLIRVMLKGVEEDIVVLPVHDAIAVKKVDEEWAIRTLKETWLEYFKYDYCMVSSK